MNTRWDYYLSGSTQIFGRYSLADYRMDSPGIFGELVGGRGFDEAAPFAGVSRTRNQSIAAGFNHTFGSNLLTDFRFGWFRYRVNVDPGGGDVNPATEAGIPGLNLDDFSRGMPAFLSTGMGRVATPATSSTSGMRCNSRGATARCARTSGNSSSSTTGRRSKETTPSSLVRIFATQ